MQKYFRKNISAVETANVYRSKFFHIYSTVSYRYSVQFNYQDKVVLLITPLV